MEVQDGEDEDEIPALKAPQVFNGLCYLIYNRTPSKNSSMNRTQYPVNEYNHGHCIDSSGIDSVAGTLLCVYPKLPPTVALQH